MNINKVPFVTKKGLFLFIINPLIQMLQLLCSSLPIEAARLYESNYEYLISGRSYFFKFPIVA